MEHPDWGIAEPGWGEGGSPPLPHRPTTYPNKSGIDDLLHKSSQPPSEWLGSQRARELVFFSGMLYAFEFEK